MTTQNEQTQNQQTSAKILPFPVRPAVRRGGGAEGREMTPAPGVVYGGAWYHQAAIDQENALRER